jgi:error-prone DNA polymerase
VLTRLFAFKHLGCNMSSYVPLWCKSNFSFLEGASHPDELVDEAYRLGLPALALTDRDGVYGVVRAHVKARTTRNPHS